MSKTKKPTRNDLIRTIDQAEKSVKEARFDKRIEKEILDNLKRIRNILYI